MVERVFNRILQIQFGSPEPAPIHPIPPYNITTNHKQFLNQKQKKYFTNKMQATNHANQQFS